MLLSTVRNGAEANVIFRIHGVGHGPLGGRGAELCFDFHVRPVPGGTAKVEIKELPTCQLAR